MDKEPGKSAQAHRVDHSVNEHLTDSSKATRVANLNLNANSITGDVGMLVNNNQNNNQNINNFFNGAIPKESVRSNHEMLSTEY